MNHQTMLWQLLALHATAVALVLSLMLLGELTPSQGTWTMWLSWAAMVLAGFGGPRRLVVAIALLLASCEARVIDDTDATSAGVVPSLADCPGGLFCECGEQRDCASPTRCGALGYCTFACTSDVDCGEGELVQCGPLTYGNAVVCVLGCDEVDVLCDDVGLPDATCELALGEPLCTFGGAP